MRLIAVLLLAMAASGCAGTRMTRGSGPMDHASPGSHAMFGGYPFQAVVVDWRIEEQHLNEGNSYVVLGSLAIDLAVDLVLAPVDLVAWAFGYRKRPMLP